ncbi:MAG TPA: hypothetical protein VNO50_22730 [Pyrinomonadaceae bacterium]|nr:hypothetical protein [Pyrinomonadaceae bacterium]
MNDDSVWQYIKGELNRELEGAMNFETPVCCCKAKFVEHFGIELR